MFAFCGVMLVTCVAGFRISGCVLGSFLALFWHHLGLWTLIMGLGEPTGGKMQKKSIWGGHIGGLVGAYWAPLPSCWIILGVFFINVLPGTSMGRDLAPKGIWGWRMCVFCVTFVKISMLAKTDAGRFFVDFGEHLGGIWEAWGRIWGVLGSCWLLLWRVGFEVRFQGISWGARDPADAARRG